MKRAVLLFVLLLPGIAHAGTIAKLSKETMTVVEEYYIVQQAPQKIALSMLEALAKIDDGVKAHVVSSQVVLSHNGMMVQRYVVLGSTDMWAEMLERAVADLRKVSFKIASHPDTKLFEIMADGMLKNLDKYSHYEMRTPQPKLNAKASLPQVLVTSESYEGGKPTDFSKNGYLTLVIETFTDTTVEHIKASVEQFAQAYKGNFRGIIIDVRGNEGGSLLQAIAAVDLFLPSGKIATVMGSNNASRQEYKADEYQVAAGIPIAVIINSRTASAAELFAAALQANRRATVIGEPSYGKSSVQISYPLSNGAEIVLTWAHFLTAGGRDIEGKGVRPDMKINKNQYDEAKKILSLRDVTN